MIAKRLFSLALIGGALGLVALVGGACGAAEEPTTTPTTAPRAVASPTPIPIATPTPTAKEPKYGGIAVIAHRADPPTWDPMRGGGISTTALVSSMYNNGSIVKPCPEDSFLICPSLAEKWETNADSTVWTFKIRDNVFWHDGKPFTAEDVKYWFDLSIKGVTGRRPSNSAADFGPVTTAEVLDGNRLRVTLSSPRPLYTEFFSTSGNQIAHPRHLIQPQIDKGNANVTPLEVGAIATGPFKLLKYERGSIIQVRKFDKFWQKDEKGRQLPFLDGIDFPIITDSSAAVAAFRTGRVDNTPRGSGFHLTPEQAASIKKDLGDKAWLARFPYLGWQISPNSLRAPYNDDRVRQALHLWFDRQAGVEAVHGGFAVVSTMYSPGSIYEDPDFINWPGYNPKTKEADRKRAKELLAEAGFPNGFKTVLQCRDVWGPWCEYTDGQLRGLGIQPTVKRVDQNTNTEIIAKGEFEINVDSISGDTPNFVAADYLNSNPQAGIKHKDKKVDDLFEQIAVTADQAKRVALAREAQKYLILEKSYTIMLWYEEAVLAFRDYVKGVQIPKVQSSNNTDYATVWLDK